MGDLTPDEFVLGSTRTPQGTVISPLLFNIALIGLPQELQKINGLHHTIYADDITIWTHGLSSGQTEQVLQEAVQTVEKYLCNTGLTCSAEKSELLIYKPTRRGRKPANYNTLPRTSDVITIKTACGTVIPTLSKIRVLGLIIESNGHNGETIRKLETSVTQTVRLIKRIANRHSGMKEGNTIRLVQAFVISKITYVAPYLKWQAADKIKLEGLIRKAHKVALGLPVNASTELLMKLGIHNTLDEIIQAQQIAQYERLARTPTGRTILEKAPNQLPHPTWEESRHTE